MTTGKDYDYLRREFDIPRLNALNACTRDSPPAHINMHRIRLILEAFMGIDSDPPNNEQQNEDDDDELMNDLMNFPQGS